MDKEFITIREASRLLRRADTAIMLLIKEALQAGVERERIMTTEMQDGRMMYLVNKAFLFEETQKEKDALEGSEGAEDFGHEKLHEQKGPAESQEQTGSLDSDLLSAKDEMIAILQKIVDTKDQHIEDLSGKIDQLIERDHETNILLKGLQDRLFLLEQGNPEKKFSGGRSAGEKK
jgi:hypothetical protein